MLFLASSMETSARAATCLRGHVSDESSWVWENRVTDLRWTLLKAAPVAIAAGVANRRALGWTATARALDESLVGRYGGYVHRRSDCWVSLCTDMISCWGGTLETFRCRSQRSMSSPRLSYSRLANHNGAIISGILQASSGPSFRIYLKFLRSGDLLFFNYSRIFKTVWTFRLKARRAFTAGRYALSTSAHETLRPNSPSLITRFVEIIR